MHGSTQNTPQTPTSAGGQHRYFIVFQANGMAGSTEVHLHKPIRSQADIDYIKKIIEQAGNVRGLVITGWQRFEQER